MSVEFFCVVPTCKEKSNNDNEKDFSHLDLTDAAIEEFNNIDFSSILKNGFNASYNINEKSIKRLQYNHQFEPLETEDKENIDISLLAGNVVTNAMHIPRSLFCPFCANEYMFEFTLKDHLKRFHKDDLLKYVNRDRNASLELSETNNSMYSCPYCAAIFYLYGLIPKHITNHHGNNLFKQWQTTKGNIEEYNLKKDNESSIIYAVCSPGLSDIFDGLDTNSSRKRKNIQNISEISIHPVSILKKTPVSGRIISSPSSASIRRCKLDLTRKSPLARRALRFDLPPSPPDNNDNKNLLNLSSTSSTESSTKNRNLSKKLIEKKTKNLKKKKLKTNQILTSTPINFLDDNNHKQNNCFNENRIKKINENGTLEKRKPSFWASETYQCAYCKQTYDNNANLLQHLSLHHKSIKYIFKPKYRCSLCGAKFYRNSYLVRHCQFQHTPRK